MHLRRAFREADRRHILFESDPEKANGPIKLSNTPIMSALPFLSTTIRVSSGALKTLLSAVFGALYHPPAHIAYPMVV
jgi:hypothetical protein